MKLLTVGLLAGALTVTSFGLGTVEAEAHGGAPGRRIAAGRHLPPRPMHGPQRRFIPGHYERQTQRVWQPGEWVYETVTEAIPGHYETQMQMVTEPGRYEMVERQVFVAAYYRDRRTGLRIEVGGGGIAIGVSLGGGGGHCGTYGVELVPAHYETTCEKVWIPERCVERPVQVWIPERCVTKQVPVWKGGCYVERCVDVWVPGRWVEIGC
jgi:hypothetical protein